MVNIKRARSLWRKSNKFAALPVQERIFLVLPDALWQNRNNFLTTAKSSLARGALQIWCSFRQVKIFKEK